MKIKIITTAAVTALLLSACSKPAVSTSRTDNPEIDVELLFEHDGVKVFRFEDGGRPVYFTDGRARWTVPEQHGKLTVPVPRNSFSLEAEDSRRGYGN